MGMGGGAASGAVDYPEYMRRFHGNALNDSDGIGSGGTTLDISLADAMNTALNGVSPYAGFVTVDVDDAMLGAGKVITDFTAPFNYMASLGELNFSTIFTAAKTNSGLSDYIAAKEARLIALFDAESALLDDELEVTTLPNFKAGMRDINAVMSSAFVLGTSNIYAQKTKALAKNDAIFRWEAEKLQAELVLRNDEFALRLTLAQFEIQKTVAAVALEFARNYISGRAQGDDFKLETASKDALWDLKVFQYGGNFLGSIAGSAVSVDHGYSSGQKLGMAAATGLAGAGIGAYMGAQAGSIGGPMGAAIGGAAGLLLGYFGNR